MNIRPFEWRDLTLLHRYRKECVYLHCALMLTRGPLFVPTGAFLSTLAHATGLFTYLVEADSKNEAKERSFESPFVGQVSHQAGAASAQITFFTPEEGLDRDPVSGLVEQMLGAVGKRGALHILAEVEEQSAVQGVLRQVGFGIYARQSIWGLDRKSSRDNRSDGMWRSAGKQDEAGIRFLYTNLVPGLVQQVEMLPSGRLHGLVYYRGGEMLAYVDLEYGLSGILAQPFIHPDAEAVAASLVHLLRRLPDLYARPVYLRVRSYQSWLDSVLEDFGAEHVSRQAVMVRHLAVKRRAMQNMTVPALNGSTPEPTVPVARIETK
jgi:hypothetical protein